MLLPAMDSGPRPRTLLSGSDMVMGETDRLRQAPMVGHMYMYFYDPKWKKELPYYDQFPLVIPIEIYKDGFLGLNLHYLPYKYRAILMGKLLDLASDKKYNERTKLIISYQMLKAAAKYKEVSPCVKRYLKSHFRSKFLKVPPKAWQIAIFLPVERFKKAGKTRVWADSVNGK
jgi:hypothetical protein